MGKLAIGQTYSHLFGEEVLRQRYPELAGDIDGMRGLVIPPPTPSKEKTKAGKLVYRGDNFNPVMKTHFESCGWDKHKLATGGEVDFFKERVAMEVQFGKYSFVAYDITKLQDLFAADEIDVGIEVIPSAKLFAKFYTGVANFESEVARLKARGRNDPPMPIWIIGVDVS